MQKRIQVTERWLGTELKKARLNLANTAPTVLGEPLIERNTRVARKLFDLIPKEVKNRKDVLLAAIHHGTPKSKLVKFPKRLQDAIRANEQTRTMIKSGEYNATAILEHLVHSPAIPMVEVAMMADTMTRLATGRIKVERSKKINLAKIALEVHGMLCRNSAKLFYHNIADNAFKILKPRRYNFIKGEIDTFKTLYPDYINAHTDLSTVISDAVKDMNLEKAKNGLPPVEVRLEPISIKGIYSIHQKLEDYKKSNDPEKNEKKYPDQLPDFLRTRIVLEKGDLNDIRTLHSLINAHDHVKEITFLSDYLGHKRKPTGYQALHIVVNFKDETIPPIELQIKTQRMHNHAEGLSGHHFFYKQLERVKGQPRIEIPMYLVKELEPQLGPPTAYGSPIVTNAIIVNDEPVDAPSGNVL